MRTGQGDRQRKFAGQRCREAVALRRRARPAERVVHVFGHDTGPAATLTVRPASRITSRLTRTPFADNHCRRAAAIFRACTALNSARCAEAKLNTAANKPINTAATARIRANFNPALPYRPAHR